ncbi:Cyclic nucleotide-gated cation channel,Cyclic nucleotide-gated channel rod photoreceptor subunit alpha,cGMP-gated cation channel alpha-1,Cyclic nucleotide-gated channel cone photoreceptor subunit alpha,Cyclic nucleotide-gated olfactory channel,Cyclic nucleotide-gated cation channel alpha-3 [Mytilus edulis]|uniref:Cyclic nucleotide-binding domain-containing protein n=1 Tax=Mytilus edulis TaxID=6550 RepID=A0A8S3TK14_MYTED|nr:Cyclic nucleotide-gated cation channel,Cyclic nucleotide-gated channel rod photoreceptor subunit alpha,cGMP-gated cation channel alpha-1,Cyclic nucleotide-gated channel cone photoreceptor subunit alpha,Cyclic nucleotide-gated olfactory channel,Cyclic nucleotide-gated cation channel alpha-3 [Mytilus edulis]
MSIKSDKDEKSADIELQTVGQQKVRIENGNVPKDQTHSDSESPNNSFSLKQRKQTKWTSVRHVIQAANVVKKPMSAKKKGSLSRQDSFLKKFSTRQHYKTDSEESVDSDDEMPGVVYVHNDVTVFKPDGSPMFYWLLIVTIAVLYNLWTCIVRQAFRELQYDHKYMWITFDIVSDLIYILDIVAQLRTGYLEQGLMVLDGVKLAKRYIRSNYFKVDIITLLPFDFIQFAVGWQPLLRFPRFLKVHRSLRFLYMLETRTAYPNFVRVANLTHMLFLGCHWFAAFYFMISEAEGFHSEWSYPQPSGSHQALTRKYLASLFWSTLTLTTIGDLPPPETNWEYLFVIGSYLIGVFIFATIVGQVGNVITNRNASRLEFERLLDGAKLYMRMHNVPPPVQRRVQRWYDYVWTRGRMTGSDINSLGLLPDKLKTELAIHVNLETLKKVTIFNECQPEFLHDLVLKMKAYIFTPGDLICRRGEVAKEMFIIADGVVEIISESGKILTQMSTGNFFGEIGILNLDGGINRRTADVKSVGYAELFVLSREDVLEALKDHPDAKHILVEFGKKRLAELIRMSMENINNNCIDKCTNLPFRKSSIRHLDKLFKRTKAKKSKYRVGSSCQTEICVHDVNGDSISINDVTGVNAPENGYKACAVIETSSKNSSDDSLDSSCLKPFPLLISVQNNVNGAITNTAECICDTQSNNDSQDSELHVPTINKNVRESNQIEGPIEKSPTNTDQEEQQTDQACCRCGHLEEKLFLIEKQLMSVEKLYAVGIKQLETFNEINEKYVQMLNTIPEYNDQPMDSSVDSEHGERVLESTKL